MRICARPRAIVPAAALALLAAIALPAAAEDAARALAAWLVEAGEYDAAITEYRRFLFFNEGHPDAWRVSAEIASCYRRLERWQNAVAWYSLAGRRAPDEPGRVEAEIQAAVTEIAAGSFSAAEFRLLSLRTFSPPDDLAGRAARYLGLAYGLSDRIEEADRELRAFAARLPGPRREAVEEILGRCRSAPRRSPQTARVLSMLVPGLGQMYAGDFLDGLNALLVNGASAGLVAWAVMERSYAEAGLAFSYLFSRYYAGGMSNAERQAVERNERIDRAFAAEILDELAD